MLQFDNNENTVQDLLEKVESFSVFTKGKEEIIAKDHEKFSKIKEKLNYVFFVSRLMPAYCVSLHQETQQAMQNEKWFQINFKETLLKNELPFSALLFKLEEVSGFNLIRLHENKYEGRCLYLSLDETIDLENFVLNY